MSILIGNYIYSALSSDEDLAALVSDRIYPVAIPEGSTFPFVVYSGVNVQGEYSKDGCIGDNISFQIACVSETYTNATRIAENVRIIVEGISVDQSDSYTHSFELVGSSDNYEGDAYVIMINFTAKTNYK